MTTSEQNRNSMPCKLACYEGKQSAKSRSKSSPEDWCCLNSQNHLMPALFDHDFGGNREGIPGACPFEVLHINSFSLDYWSIYWHLCSTIALSRLIFWSGWTNRAHLMYPVLSYQVVSQDHVHFPMNMTALMVCILRGEERGSVLLKPLTLIAGLNYKSLQTGSRHAQVQGTIRQQAKMCFPECEFWKSSLHCEWLLVTSKQL